MVFSPTAPITPSCPFPSTAANFLLCVALTSSLPSSSSPSQRLHPWPRRAVTVTWRSRLQICRLTSSNLDVPACLYTAWLSFEKVFVDVTPFMTVPKGWWSRGQDCNVGGVSTILFCSASKSDSGNPGPKSECLGELCIPVNTAVRFGFALPCNRPPKALVQPSVPLLPPHPQWNTRCAHAALLSPAAGGLRRCLSCTGTWPWLLS